MKKIILCLFIIFTSFCNSQQTQKWKGYFSYNQIKDLSESNLKLVVSAQNSIFVKNFASNEIKTINTIDGLSGENISSIYHSDAFNKTIVGYESGLIIVINEIDGNMLKVVDIINKNLPSNIKKINHFMEYNGILYVSCDFGIVQYNMTTLLFGDTFFIGPNGQEVKVYQTTILNNEIYAVTQYNGIRKASISNPNLNDFAQWQVFDNGYWVGLVNFNNQLIGLNSNNSIAKYNGTFFMQFASLNQTGLDIRATIDNLIVTSQNQVYVYNTSLSQINLVSNSQITTLPVTFTCATVINNILYIGTNENGVITTPLSNINFDFILPDGPLKNNVFSIHTSASNLWAVFGGYDIFYNPYSYYQPLAQFGISKFSQNGWQNIPYSSVLGAKALSRIAINPNNENQVFMGSCFSGLLKVENSVPTILYNQTNSGLESLQLSPPNSSYVDIRINATNFDKNGNLWLTNSRIKNALKVLKSNGQWQSYNMENILSSYNNSDFARIAIDKNGTKWIASYVDGVIAFNESINIFKKITDGNDNGNLPSKDVRAIAVDNNSQVWIGTNKGLRVLSNSSSYNSQDQMKANAIIILEDGLAQELLYEQFITDIVVNGSNQKWIGTADSGVFLFSADGQQTIYHFTKDNSPLPSNVINDIDINSVTGEIFFATDSGMVSFQGNATKPSDNLQNVYVYPNPVRPEYYGTVKIAGLISKANVKITDIEGNLVFETTSEGGTIEWDTTAFGNYRVASGVYMVFIAAPDGSDSTVKKVMIIR